MIGRGELDGGDGADVLRRGEDLEAFPEAGVGSERVLGRRVGLGLHGNVVPPARVHCADRATR